MLEATGRLRQRRRCGPRRHRPADRRRAVTLEGPVEKTTSTGPDGLFSFGALPGGSYRLVEGEAAGYADQSPNEIPVELFVDGNDDGMPNEDDQGIPDVEFQLVGFDMRGTEINRLVRSHEQGRRRQEPVRGWRRRLHENGGGCGRLGGRTGGGVDDRQCRGRS